MKEHKDKRAPRTRRMNVTGVETVMLSHVLAHAWAGCVAQ